MNRLDYDMICELVFQQTSIVLGPNKEYLVRTRLQQLAREKGLDGMEEIIQEIRRRPSSPLRNAIADVMTTNETSFFRDGSPFEAMRLHILPDIIRRRRKERKLLIWSAACSTGQEPYTLAILLQEYFPEVRNWQIQITATDYSQRVLRQARAGCYTDLDIQRGMPAALRDRYFQRTDDNLWQVIPSLKENIRFQQCNLTSMWPITQTQDLILVRNVLIYFNNETKQQILTRAVRLLHPEGFLMLGAAESPYNVYDLYQRRPFGRVIAYQPLAANSNVA